MTREQTIDKSVLKTDAGRAAVAQAWLDGMTQKKIAQAFGLGTATSVNIAIVAFIQKFCPDKCGREIFSGAAYSRAYISDFTPMACGDKRKRIVELALMRRAEAQHG